MEDCIKKDSICFIYLTNGTISSKKNTKHIQKMKQAKIEARKKGSLAKFGHTDGICQFEIRNEYGFSENDLPAMAVFYGRKNRGAVLSGEMTEDSVRNFMDAVLKGNLIT